MLMLTQSMSFDKCKVGSLQPILGPMLTNRALRACRYAGLPCWCCGSEVAELAAVGVQSRCTGLQGPVRPATG